MSTEHPHISLLRSTLEIFGVAFLRFRPLSRLWVIWLVLVNAAGLLFIGHREAQVVLVAVGVAVFMQALIYQKMRFVRILGATHVLWLPMLAWIATRLATLPADQQSFRIWLIALAATNLVSLVVDAAEATRFVLGARKPYYTW